MQTRNWLHAFHFLRFWQSGVSVLCAKSQKCTHASWVWSCMHQLYSLIHLKKNQTHCQVQKLVCKLGRGQKIKLQDTWCMTGLFCIMYGCIARLFCIRCRSNNGWWCVSCSLHNKWHLCVVEDFFLLSAVKFLFLFLRHYLLINNQQIFIKKSFIFCWDGGKERGMAYMYTLNLLPASYLEENMTTLSAFAL